MRNLCKECGKRPVAINYRKGDRVFYRSKCDHCARNSKKEKPMWASSGYRKKSTCDRCGFSSSFPIQFDVYHLDGNLANCKFNNLKTVCANCQRLLYSIKLPWKHGDLKSDF